MLNGVLVFTLSSMTELREVDKTWTIRCDVLPKLEILQLEDEGSVLPDYQGCSPLSWLATVPARCLTVQRLFRLPELEPEEIENEHIVELRLGTYGLGQKTDSYYSVMEEQETLEEEIAQMVKLISLCPHVGKVVITYVGKAKMDSADVSKSMALVRDGLQAATNKLDRSKALFGPKFDVLVRKPEQIMFERRDQ